MFTGCPSAESSFVAARPSFENGTLTTMCSCKVRSARPSATMPAASAETTSADVGPSTRSQMRRMMSPGSPSSLARSVGLVVAPERTLQAAISSTSATDPVSMKSSMGQGCPRPPTENVSRTGRAVYLRRGDADADRRQTMLRRIRKALLGNDETLVFLEEYGVDYAQGFQIGKPEPVAEVWPALEAGR